MKILVPFDNGFFVDAIIWTPKTYVEPLHWHSCLEVGVCIAGKGSFFFGEKEFSVEVGDVFVVNNHERHIAQSDELEPCQFIFIYFAPSLVEHYNPELLMPFVYHSHHFINKIGADNEMARAIGNLIIEIYHELRECSSMFKCIVQCKLVEACVLLFRHYEGLLAQGEWRKTLQLYSKIQPALYYIKRNFRDKITLENVANVLALSTSRTRHLFRESLGEGFKEYVLQLRINEAKRLLIRTDSSITDVYLNSGFQSHAPFYRAFKKYVGISPLLYRNQFSSSLLEHEVWNGLEEEM